MVPGAEATDEKPLAIKKEEPDPEVCYFNGSFLVMTWSELGSSSCLLNGA